MTFGELSMGDKIYCVATFFSINDVSITTITFIEVVDTPFNNNDYAMIKVLDEMGQEMNLYVGLKLNSTPRLGYAYCGPDIKEAYRMLKSRVNKFTNYNLNNCMASGIVYGNNLITLSTIKWNLHRAISKFLLNV